MTETGMLQDIPDTLAKLRRLREVGLGISVDDFGTGYSSLSYLQRFPVTSLKIARDFVHVDESEPDSWELASAIVSMGRALHLEVVAEGVEHLYQLNRLRELGCRYAQGYYLARPSPATRSTRCWTLGGGAGTALAQRAARHIGRAIDRGASDGLSPLSRPRIRRRAGERRYVANGTRTGTFGPCRRGCQRLRSWPEVAISQIRRDGLHRQTRRKAGTQSQGSSGSARRGSTDRPAARHRPHERWPHRCSSCCDPQPTSVVTASRRDAVAELAVDDAGVRLERRLRRADASPGCALVVAFAALDRRSGGPRGDDAGRRLRSRPRPELDGQHQRLRSAPMTGGLPATPGAGVDVP